VLVDPSLGKGDRFWLFYWRVPIRPANKLCPSGNPFIQLPPRYGGHHPRCFLRGHFLLLLQPNCPLSPSQIRIGRPCLETPHTPERQFAALIRDARLAWEEWPAALNAWLGNRLLSTGKDPDAYSRMGRE
jgi:hypothetical protein